MTRRRVGRTIVIAGAFLWLSSGLGSVDAQVLPPLPQEFQPVLQVISPTTSAACATGGVTVVLLPVVLADVPIPPEVQALFGPVFEVCGALPTATGGYTCSLDKQALDLLARIEASLIASLPIVPGPLGLGLNQIVHIEEAVLPGTPTVTPSIAQALMCEPVAGDGSESAEEPPNTTTPPVTDPVDLPTIVPPVASPGLDGFPGLPPLPANPPKPSAPPVEPEVVPPAADVTPVRAPTTAIVNPVQTITSSGFDYPAVFGMPFALLLLVTGLAVELTRPIRASPTRYPRKETQT